ncbi:MAG: O-antigen ligase family protein [Thermoanaerobaculaceae bacterium]|nr:O-antigen ligase family protein [Thermoanaerobaculaceae bacterium]
MPRALRHLGIALAILAGMWVAGADGAYLRPGAAVATALVVVLLTGLRGSLGGLAVDAPRLWLGGLVAWAAIAAAAMPVARSEAGYLTAVGAVAWLVALVTSGWRARAWACGAVTGLGAMSGLSLMVGRWAEGVRSDGLLGNPNLSATVALLGLASAPFVRLPVAARLALGGCTLGGIVASGSRAAMLGTGAMTLVWMLAGARNRWLRRGALVALLVVAAGLATRLATDRDPLRFERVRIWSTALAVARDSFPWGTGPGGFADAAIAHNFPQSNRPARFGLLPTLAESDLLQLLATLGLPGMLLGGGLAWSLLRSLRAPAAHLAGCVATVAVTSAFHTQLAAPVVAWTATMAVAAALPPGRRWHVPMPASAVRAGGSLLATVLAVALLQPAWWLGGTPGSLLDGARALAAQAPRSDARLADAEALAWRATTVRPRWSEAWSTLGAVRAARARLRDDPALWPPTIAAFRQARRCNPLSAFAALEEGRAARAARNYPAARAALQAAVGLEPNLAAAWTELAGLALQEGRLAAARRNLAEAMRAAAIRVEHPTPYEHVLLAVDPAALARLHAALLERR